MSGERKSRGIYSLQVVRPKVYLEPQEPRDSIPELLLILGLIVAIIVVTGVLFGALAGFLVFLLFTFWVMQ